MRATLPLMGADVGELEARQQRVVTAARRWIGTPYQHQASLLGVGCDCLGLVRGVWRDVMGAEPELPPPYAADWAESSPQETLAEAAARHLQTVPAQEMRAGDVVLFRWRAHLPAKHAAICVSTERMIHAQDGVGVREVALSPWWMRRLSHVFRFPEAS